MRPQLPFYVVAQLAGSLLACVSVNGVMEPREEHFYGTAPMMAGGHTRLPFLLELVASAVLMIVIAIAARGSVCPYYPFFQLTSCVLRVLII